MTEDVRDAVRRLLERDVARNAGDKLARAVLAHLQGQAVDFRQALVDYVNDDGPASALPVPEGGWIVNRYCWARHITVIVSVHDDEARADAALARLKAEEQAARAGPNPPRPQHYAKVRAGSLDPTKRGFVLGGRADLDGDKRGRQ